MKILRLVFLFLVISSGITEGATLGVTVNTTNTLTSPFLPAARSATQVENGPAWKASATVLGVTTFSENLETLTPGAAVTLNWLTARTKQITLDQDTTFSFSNTPSIVTNLQRMIVQVIGDGVSSATFTGVTWQPVQTIPIPPAGSITTYRLEASNSIINGYDSSNGGSSGSAQVFSGFYGGGLPTDVPVTTAALAYDLSPPNTLYMWDGSIWW